MHKYTTGQTIHGVIRWLGLCGIPALFIMEMMLDFFTDPLWFVFAFEWLTLLGVFGLKWRYLGDIHSRSPVRFSVCSPPRRVLEIPLHEATLRRLLVLFGEWKSIITVIAATKYCASDTDICHEHEPHHSPAPMSFSVHYFDDDFITLSTLLSQNAPTFRCHTH